MKIEQLQLGLAMDATHARCPLCLVKLKGRRCRWCDKGEIPEPGKPAWRRWTRGLRRTIWARLEAVGAPTKTIFAALDAIVVGDREIPAEVAPLLVDIARMPISVKAWWRAIDHGVLQSRAYAALRGEGVPSREADEMASKVATEILDARDARKRALRIAEDHVVRLRVAIDHVVDQAEVQRGREHAAELEAEAVDVEQLARDHARRTAL